MILDLFHLNKDTITTLFNCQEPVKQFAITYHYPKITSLEQEPLNFENCLQDFDSLYEDLNAWKKPNYKINRRNEKTLFR
jgi:hypothetical protein